MMIQRIGSSVAGPPANRTSRLAPGLTHMASRPEKFFALQGRAGSVCLLALLALVACVSAQGTRDFKSTMTPADSSRTAGTATSAAKATPTPPAPTASRSLVPYTRRDSSAARGASRRDSSGTQRESKPPRREKVPAPARLSDSTGRIDTAGTVDTLAPVPLGRRLKFEFYEIEDSELLADLWRMSGGDSLPEEGRYQVLKVRDDTVSRAYLLREGTQVGRIPDSLVSGLRRAIRTRSGMQEGRLSQNLFGNFWNPVHPLAPFQWPTGLSLEFRNSGTVMQYMSPELAQTYGGWFAVRPFPWAHVEAGYSRTRYAGGLNRNLYNPNDDRPDWRFWGYRQAWGYVALGVPGIKYELALDNRNLPEYFWLDPNAGSGAYLLGREISGNPAGPSDEFQDATVIRGWKRGGRTQPQTPNYSQTLRLKIGQVRYAAVFDPDVYNSVIHDVMFEELPAPFGELGLGFVFAEGAAHTRMRFDLFPVKLGIPVPKGSSLRLFFLRFEIAVRDTKTFHIGLASTLHLDSPILRPGGTP
jgi:hypothetical protein